MFLTCIISTSDLDVQLSGQNTYEITAQAYLAWVHVLQQIPIPLRRMIRLVSSWRTQQEVRSSRTLPARPTPTWPKCRASVDVESWKTEWRTLQRDSSKSRLNMFQSSSAPHRFGSMNPTIANVRGRSWRVVDRIWTQVSKAKVLHADLFFFLGLDAN